MAVTSCQGMNLGPDKRALINEEFGFFFKVK